MGKEIEGRNAEQDVYDNETGSFDHEHSSDKTYLATDITDGHGWKTIRITRPIV
jgi:hypothetical protein